MRRRTFLAALTAGTASTLAGCGAPAGSTDGSPTNGSTGGTVRTTTGVPGTDPAARPASTDTDEPGPTRTPPADPDLPVPESELRRSAARDAIAAITEPAFARDWEGLTFEFENPGTGETSTYRPELAPDEEVIGVERNGEARAYPLKVLRWHEVVNDEFDGPLLVTYCPLCRSGIAAERTVEGEPAVFGVSGLLWGSNLVMYDRPTGSLWSQVRAQAIRGPLVGTDLSLVPAQLTTWRAWRADHPDTTVLLPSPRSETVRGPLQINYRINLYQNQAELNQAVELNPSRNGDGRLAAYEVVLGIATGDVARAYPLSVVERDGPVNDRVDGRPVVVATGQDRTLVAYDRRVGGETLTFEPSAEGGDTVRAGGSRWDVGAGRALDGPLAGERLTPVESAAGLYWFAWLDSYPETTVYGRE